MLAPGQKEQHADIGIAVLSLPQTSWCKYRGPAPAATSPCSREHRQANIRITLTRAAAHLVPAINGGRPALWQDCDSQAAALVLGDLRRGVAMAAQR